MRCVAVDWSGRASRAHEFIWIAEAIDGRLTFLENGRTGTQVVEWLLDRASLGEPIVVGLDFAFTFPAWFCAQNGWSTGPEIWRAMAGPRGAAILRDEPTPFWGRTQARPAGLDDPARSLRSDEREHGTKSVFQIGGAGAVGTGSIRGMPQLLALRERYAVWPFDPPSRATVLEIYPRAMYGPGRVVKSRWTSRRDALSRWFTDHELPLIERAAGSEDAFDAAVTALRMSCCAEQLHGLPALPGAVEGRIWTPATAS